jgi:hypothetical protein
LILITSTLLISLWGDLLSTEAIEEAFERLMERMASRLL